MRMSFLTALVGVAVLSSSAMAQTAPSPGNYQGTTPWQFRDSNERISRLAVAQTHIAVRNGQTSGFGGSGFGGSPLGSSTTIGNYNQVTNNYTCTSNGAGSPVTCSGNATSTGTNQSNNDSTLTSDTNVSDNTVTNTRTVNRTSTPQ